MPSRRFTSGGKRPPACRYWCTASRPVKTTPVMTTSSPTFSARILDSVNGLVSWIINIARSDRPITPLLHHSITPGSVEPPHNFAPRAQRHAQPPVRPAHVADAHEIGGRQPV